MAKRKTMSAHFDCRPDNTKLKTRLTSTFKSIKQRPVVILCIGTDRSTGDSLGPLVGTQLTDYNLPKLKVYGTLEYPVHAQNLEEHVKLIQESYDDPFIIAVDACLGRLDSIGHIKLSDGPMKPGAGVGKVLPETGDIHIVGIVNVAGFMEFMVLQNTRLNTVWKMAEKISSLIAQAYVKGYGKVKTAKSKAKVAC